MRWGLTVLYIKWKNAKECHLIDVIASPTKNTPGWSFITRESDSNGHH